MFTRHRLGPTNKLDCLHAMGTYTFSPQRAESFRHFLLLPSPSVVYHGRKPANLRISFRASGSQFQTSGGWPTQAWFWLEWGCSDLLNSVIPTGADHRKSGDLWSGGPGVVTSTGCEGW